MRRATAKSHKLNSNSASRPLNYIRSKKHPLALRSARVERKATTERPRVVLATEAAVKRQTPTGIVDEVLLMAGIVWRYGPPRIPLLAGDESSVRNIVGSVRNLRVLERQLVGDIYFASDPQAQSVASKFADGFLTSVEVIHAPVEILDIPAGRTSDYGGISLSGPAALIVRWRPLHARLVAS